MKKLLILFVLCAPIWGAAPAKIQIVQSARDYTTGCSFSVSSLTTNSLVYLACLYTTANPGTVTVSDNKSGGSNTYTAAEACYSANGASICAFYAVGVGAATTITVSASGGSFWNFGTMVEYSGVNTSSAPDAVNHGSAYSGNCSGGCSYTSGNLVTTTAGTVMIGLHFENDTIAASGVTWSPATNWTDQDGGLTSYRHAQDRIVTTTGTYASSGTGTYAGTMTTFSVAAAFKSVDQPGGARRRVVLIQ